MSNFCDLTASNQSEFPEGRDIHWMVMISGTVMWFSDDKGYGYLRTLDGLEVFVHHAQIAGEGFRTLVAGATVTFEIGDDGRGPTAHDVAPSTTG